MQILTVIDLQTFIIVNNTANVIKNHVTDRRNYVNKLQDNADLHTYVHVN